MYHCCFEALVFTGLRTLKILEQYSLIAASFAMFVLFLVLYLLLLGAVFPVILCFICCSSFLESLLLKA